MRQLPLLVLLIAMVFACSPTQPAPAPPPPPVVVGSVSAAQSETSPPPPRRAAPLAELVLREWQQQSRCDGDDYFPRGGLQSFFCHRPAHASPATLRSMTKTKVFASGPHKEELALHEADDFGRYDPSFVRWLVDNAVPARDSAGRRETQAYYEARLSPLAEIFWHTLLKIEHEKKCFEGERQAYLDRTKQKSLPRDYYERWFFFMNPWFCERGPQANATEFYYENGFDAGVNGNVTKSVVGFWLRRSIDGTFDAFAEGLRKLLAAYQPDLLAAEWKPADPSSLRRAIDGGIKAAAACKDPRAPKDSVYVAITIATDGHVEAWIKSPAVKGTAQASCIERAFASQKVTAFVGKDLPITRTLPLK